MSARFHLNWSGILVRSRSCAASVMVSAAHAIAALHGRRTILTLFMTRLYPRHRSCTVCRSMAREGQIDRQKHEVDIAERVLEGGVGTESNPAEGARVVAIEV